MRTELRRPFELQGVRLDLEGSIGIALYPQHGDDVDTLMQRADVAMYLAKEDHGGCQLYAADRDEYSPGKLALVAELRRGIDQGELFLHYQPQARLAEDRIVGVEALVRWQHPSRGLLPPNEFVPLAERTGLTHALTLFVLTEALGQLHRWLEAGLDLDLAVNLSARDLLDESLPGSIVELLAANNVPASRLELEITESVILADPLRARRILLALSEIGVRIAIDDYGSGYSSLSYLKHLPVDVIKIDRSFVLNMATDASDAVIVRSTIELGRSLGLTVVAEGVETAANWEQLKALGCELAQGFYLSRPVPADQIAAVAQPSRRDRRKPGHALEAVALERRAADFPDRARPFPALGDLPALRVDPALGPQFAVPGARRDGRGPIAAAGPAGVRGRSRACRPAARCARPSGCRAARDPAHRPPRSPGSARCSRGAP